MKNKISLFLVILIVLQLVSYSVRAQASGGELCSQIFDDFTYDQSLTEDKKVGIKKIAKLIQELEQFKHQVDIQLGAADEATPFKSPTVQYLNNQLWIKKNYLSPLRNEKVIEVLNEDDIKLLLKDHKANTPNGITYPFTG